MLQFLLTLLSPRQASELKPDVETTCHPKQPNQRLPSQISLGHILPNQNDVLLSQVRAGMYGETWCRSRVQTDMHSKVFLRSGQACTLPPGVARESRNDQCQYQYQMQFTRTCSRTSLRHVLFPEHSRKSRPALFPPISMILMKSSRHTRNTPHTFLKHPSSA